MIETIRDDEDKVVAYIEWSLVNNSGRTSKLGKYIFVNELWIHKSLRRGKILRGFIQLIGTKTPTARYAYWERRKYDCRMKMFKVEQLLKKE